MAALTIPPIRLGLVGTGLAVEKLRWPALGRLADHGGAGPTQAAAERAASPALDDADAVPFGVRPLGSVGQSVANAMVVQRALDSAERAAVLEPDPVPGSTGLLDGLPGQQISSSASFAA